jgi:hypothetical protein
LTTATLLALLLLLSAKENETHRRVALLVGNNLGDASRPELKYAEDDAQQMSEVLRELGGVTSTLILVGGSGGALDAAFDELDRTLGADSRATTLFFFYSGHADSSALLMNGSRYPFERLRKRLESSPARLFVAFVDACESGQIIRAKGGRPIPIIDLDLSHLDRRLEGGVFLASSGAGELAQESDELRGSFFTHYLVSGLRGAADTSGDRRVSLEEAYQFVYHHTLDRTRSSILGPQHPSYGLHVDGRGELVLTWMNEGASYLILPGEAEGTYFVRDVGRSRTLAEVDKRAGTQLRVALPAGRYEVSRIEAKEIWSSEVELGAHAELQFDPTTMSRSPLRDRQAKGGSNTFAIGAAYTLASGYLRDSGLRHGADVRWSYRIDFLELGLLGSFATSSYTRSDAIAIRFWELGGGGFVEAGLDLFSTLRGFAGVELRWMWAHQRAVLADRTEIGKGSVVPVLARAGISYRLSDFTLVSSVVTGPAIFDGPDGLTSSWTIGGQFGLQLGF